MKEKEIKLITIAGGSASGKTTIANDINKYLQNNGINSLLISQDDYTLCPSVDLDLLIPISEYNFDRPYAIDTKHLFSDINKILRGNEVMLPKYYFGEKPKEYDAINSGKPDIVILEGTFVLFYEYLNTISHSKIFVDVNEEIRLQRRIDRDLVHRGISKEKTIERYNRFVKDSHDKMIQPSINIADFVIENNLYNLEKLMKDLFNKSHSNIHNNKEDLSQHTKPNKINTKRR
jgi:uridine kinase